MIINGSVLKASPEDFKDFQSYLRLLVMIFAWNTSPISLTLVILGMFLREASWELVGNLEDCKGFRFGLREKMPKNTTSTTRLIFKA